jgi:hypothetical protein
MQRPCTSNGWDAIAAECSALKLWIGKIPAMHSANFIGKWMTGGYWVIRGRLTAWQSALVQNGLVHCLDTSEGESLSIGRKNRTIPPCQTGGVSGLECAAGNVSKPRGGGPPRGTITPSPMSRSAGRRPLIFFCRSFCGQYFYGKGFQISGHGSPVFRAQPG